jgi:hypothetical protein
MEKKPVLILLLIQIDGLKQNNYSTKQKQAMVFFERKKEKKYEKSI